MLIISKFSRSFSSSGTFSHVLLGRLPTSNFIWKQGSSSSDDSSCELSVKLSDLELPSPALENLIYSFPDKLKPKSNDINEPGFLVVSSKSQQTLELNKKKCLDKIEQIISQVCKDLPPSFLTRTPKEKNRDFKDRRKEIKTLRNKVDLSEFSEKKSNQIDNDDDVKK